MQKRKICPKCLKSQKAKNFGTRQRNGKTQLKGLCRTCRASATRKHYDQNKAKIIERSRVAKAAAAPCKREMVRHYKNVPCADCSVIYPYYVMDFDHRDPKQKKMLVSRMIYTGYSREAVVEEIGKCDVVCSNCHRERTHARSIES